MSTSIFSTIVATAGISTLSRYNVLGAWVREQNLLRFERTNPRPLQGQTEAEALENLKRKVHDKLRVTTRLDPEKISAEFSALHQLRRQQRLAVKPRMELIGSETFGSQSALTLLKPVLEQEFGATLRIRYVPGLNAERPEQLRQSLAQFMRFVADALERSGGSRYAAFIPLGGYKVMTYLGALTGAYLGYPSLYIHEDTQIPHEIPPAPVRINAEALGRVAPLLRRVGEATELKALTQDERVLVEQHPYLFSREDELVGGSPFGLFLMTRPEFQYLFGTRFRVSRRLVAELERDRSFECRALVAMRRLRAILDEPARHEGALRHDTCFDSLKGANWFLYKGPGGEVHAAYRYDREQDELNIHGIWFNHDEYEREAKRGGLYFDAPSSVGLQDKTKEFYAG